jgi:uncharacterized repeat protein (TIGR03803 family)
MPQNPETKKNAKNHNIFTAAICGWGITALGAKAVERGQHAPGRDFEDRASAVGSTRYPSCIDGNGPYGLVQGTDGNLYGTTGEGGDYSNCPSYGFGPSCGTVFKITPGGQLTTLHSFSRRDGAHPAPGLVQATNGNFYGTTNAGGAHSGGTIFEITPEGQLAT